MEKTIIATEKAPKAIGPYAQAVKLSHFLYLSGQLGIDPQKGDLVSGVEEQTKQAMKNIGAILEEAGYTYDDIIKTTIYVKSLADFDVVNTIYQSYFEGKYPARSCVEVAALPKGGLVEIEALATK